MYEKSYIYVKSTSGQATIGTQEYSKVVNIDGCFYRKDVDNYRTLFFYPTSDNYNWIYLKEKKIYVDSSSAGTFYITIRYTK